MKYILVKTDGNLKNVEANWKKERGHVQNKKAKWRCYNTADGDEGGVMRGQSWNWTQISWEPWHAVREESHTSDMNHTHTVDSDEAHITSECSSGKEKKSLQHRNRKEIKSKLKARWKPAIWQIENKSGETSSWCTKSFYACETYERSESCWYV